MTEQPKGVYDVDDEAEFQKRVLRTMHFYEEKLGNIEKQLNTTNSRLALLVLFIVVIPLILGFCSFMG